MTMPRNRIRELRTVRKRARIGLEWEVYQCTVCGQDFQPIRRNQVRCSRECTRKHDSERTNRYNKAHRVERTLYRQEYERRLKSRKRKAIRDAGYRQTEQYRKRQARYVATEEAKAFHRRTQAERRARKKGATLTSDIPTVVDLLAYQSGKCANCGKKPRESVHVDHIMPLALGGKHESANLQALCQSCNQRKHAKHPFVFANEEGRLL